MNRILLTFVAALVALSSGACAESVSRTQDTAAPALDLQNGDGVDTGAAHDTLSDTASIRDTDGQDTDGQDMGLDVSEEDVDAVSDGDALTVDTSDGDAEQLCDAPNIRGTGAPLASLGPCGQLWYGLYAAEGTTDEVHRLPDYSYAGYKMGGVALPDVPVVVTVSPGAGDDGERIRAAIEQVSQMPQGAEGFRGAVLLEAGTYQVAGSLDINTNGVVLRGEGQGAGGTELVATSATQHDFIVVSGSDGLKPVSGTTQRIISSYVPVGATSFRVSSAAGFSAGDTIGIKRTPNQAWIDALDMAQYGWTPGAFGTVQERRVVEVRPNHLTIDIPLVDAFDETYGGGEVFLADTTKRVRKVGIENLRLRSLYNGNDDDNHGWKAILFSSVSDCWVRDVTAVHFAYSAVSVEDGSSFVTVQDTAMLEPISQLSGGHRYAFHVDGSMGCLFQRCFSDKARHDFVTGSKTPGPNVWLDCYSDNSYSDDGPHHRWATGLLFDNVRSYELHVENRGDSGSGHGWAGAQVLFWNSLAEGLRSFAPFGAMNWVIGTMGAQQEGQWVTGEPLGWWESPNGPVEPRSLYLAQLADRLGPDAVAAITIPEQRTGRVWARLAGWRGEGALLDATATRGDPTCANGLASDNACCAAACGACGGSGCGSRPGGVDSCCLGGVRASGRSCATHQAPCVIDPSFAPIP